MWSSKGERPQWSFWFTCTGTEVADVCCASKVHVKARHSPTTTVRFRISFTDPTYLACLLQSRPRDDPQEFPQIEEATSGITGAQNKHARDCLGEVEIKSAALQRSLIGCSRWRIRSGREVPEEPSTTGKVRTLQSVPGDSNSRRLRAEIADQLPWTATTFKTAMWEQQRRQGKHRCHHSR